MMSRLPILCLCLTLVWASPSPRNVSKVRPSGMLGPRIINGDPAAEGEFPYQAALSFTGSDGSTWFCGGSILSERWILTAGHCVDGAASAQAVTGSISPTDGDVSDSINIIINPDYDATTLANDLGLVQLATALTLDQNTATVSLHAQPLQDGAHIVVSGWGLTSDSATEISDTLNFVHLITITNSECEETYGTGSILSAMVCAVSDTADVKSTCNGDSGGPAVIDQIGPKAPPQRELVAVVSFVSSEGCESGAPSGYTRIHDYMGWIESHIHS